MSLPNRSKMISFRLSAEEYEQFRDICCTHGLRSLSELARAAVQKLASANPVQEKLLESRVHCIEAQLEVLSLELRRLKSSNATTPQEVS